VRSFQLNKLVRDGVYENMIRLGQKPTPHRLSDDEILPALRQKMLEEDGEFDPTNPQLKELADKLEVVEAAALEMGSDFDTVRRLQLERRAEMGGFAGRIYVGQLELPNDDPWVAYYAADPHRFTEIVE